MATDIKHLTVKFHEVPTGGLHFDFSEKSGELNAHLSDILGREPLFSAVLDVTPVDHQIVHVRGTLAGSMPHVCSRCAEDFSSPFKKNFLIAYYKSEDELKNLAEGIGELDGSFDLELLDGNDIDLSEVVHEQVALEIPFTPLCQEDCMGLCLQCGTNLNLSKCTCTSTEIKLKSSPFAALKNLRSQAQKN